MITDIGTVMCKEWKEILRQQGGKRSTTMTSLLAIVVMSVVMPWQAGIGWVTIPIMPLILAAMTPIILVANTVADSFAGERERHTLETLLATRLSDRTILLGKIGATVSYAWVMTQIVLLIALVPVNIRFWEGRLLLYRADVVLCSLGLSLLVACLTSTVGILVSLRASSVKQAQQTLGLTVFLLAWAPILGLQVLPDEWTAGLGEMLKTLLTQGVGLTQVTLVIAAALVALNALLLAVAMGRFQRTRLILD